MKMLHTSDWHLGRQFHNVSLLQDQEYVLDQLVEIARRKVVDVVLVAGDIYDRTVPPAAAVSLLDKVLDELLAIDGLQVIMIPGNHDSHERLGFAARQLHASGLHMIASLEQILSPVIISDDAGEVAFYGIPYLEPARVREYFDIDVSGHDETLAFVLQKIHAHNQQNGNRRTVVVSHCFLDGGDESESERPLSVGGADRVSITHFEPFNYTALGHLHAAQHKGANHIRYSGSILKYSFSEVQHKKSVARVQMDADGVCEVDCIALKPRHDMRVIEGELDDILAQAGNDPGAQDYVQIRLADRHAILDIMAKLREVYPNVLHLERPGLLQEEALNALDKQRIKQGEMIMFGDFFEQVGGGALNEEQTIVIKEVIEQARRGEVEE